MLTDDQLEQFNAAGYLAVEGFLTDHELCDCQAAVDEWVGKAAGRRQSDEIFDIDANVDSGNNAGPLVRRIFNPAQVDRRFEAIAESPRVLDVVAQLVGPNIEFHHGKINMKSARVGAEVGWHQDLPFFPHTNSSLVAIMFYLDDATLENGCLQVVPGSHRLGPLDHYADGQFIGMVTDDLARVDLNSVAKVPVGAGGITIHHCLTLHSSAQNTSGDARRVLIFEYRAADAVQLTPDQSHSRHYGKLLRGEKPATIRLEAVTFKRPDAPTDKPRSLYKLQAEYRKGRGTSDER